MEHAENRAFTVGRATEVVKIGTFVASASAILFLYGFSLTAGVNIVRFVSLTDFLRVAVQLLIPVFVVQGVAYYLGRGAYVVKKCRRKDTNGAGEAGAPQRTCAIGDKRRVDLPTLLQLLFLVLDVVLSFHAVSSENYKVFYYYLMLAMIVCWNLFFQILICRPSVMHYLKDDITEILMMMPVSIIFSVCLGMSYGSPPTNPKSGFAISYNGEHIHHITGEVLFVFDKYTVLREAGKSAVLILPSDKVSVMKTVPLPFSHSSSSVRP